MTLEDYGFKFRSLPLIDSWITEITSEWFVDICLHSSGISHHLQWEVGYQDILFEDTEVIV